MFYILSAEFEHSRDRRSPLQREIHFVRASSVRVEELYFVCGFSIHLCQWNDYSLLFVQPPSNVVNGH